MLQHKAVLDMGGTEASQPRARRLKTCLGLTQFSYERNPAASWLAHTRPRCLNSNVPPLTPPSIGVGANIKKGGRSTPVGPRTVTDTQPIPLPPQDIKDEDTTQDARVGVGVGKPEKRNSEAKGKAVHAILRRAGAFTTCTPKVGSW